MPPQVGWLGTDFVDWEAPVCAVDAVCAGVFQQFDVSECQSRDFEP